MPLTAEQLVAGANYTLETFDAKDPMDQITRNKPFYKWLLANKKPSIFGNNIYNESVYMDNGSNGQSYWGADQVTYNRRDPVRHAKYQAYGYHDGFWLSEHDLSANGIILTDDKEAQMSGAEKVQLVNLLETNRTALKNGFTDDLDLQFHLDGSQDAKAVPGLDHLVSTTPAVGTVGNINGATATYWRNNTNLGISTATTGTLTAEMEKTWRACTLYGGMVPDKIFAGSKFIDAYRKEAGDMISRQIVVSEKGGTGLDSSISGLYFKGVPIEWDPTFDALDDLLGATTYPWSKRCYFLNSRTMWLRPVQGRWMVNRRPERLPDRYVHYWAITADYGMTIGKRNANAVLSIA